MIIGPSGAGKSSLIKATLGLWPTARGELRIDGTEASKFNRAELGAQIGYLPQDIELFDGSVGENICRFEEGDPDLIIQAAQDAGVHDFILSLPNGYDTILGTASGVLSPGQCQRIALARALYRRPRLVILDEPNSNLDNVGEAALVDAIKMLRANDSTVIVITHRSLPPSTVDQVIMLVNGQITDTGSYAEVFGRLNLSNQPSPGNLGDAERPRSIPPSVKTVLPPKP
jgi:ABC-type protease/lipase transport system fused ATPase/permease subunit